MDSNRFEYLENTIKPMVCGRLELSSPSVPLQKGEAGSKLRTRIPLSLSILALKEKSIWRKFGQNEKQNDVKEKSITHAMLFSFCDPGGILTPNPQSRNLMRYTVAPRSHFWFVVQIFKKEVAPRSHF